MRERSCSSPRRERSWCTGQHPHSGLLPGSPGPCVFLPNSQNLPPRPAWFSPPIQALVSTREPQGGCSKRVCPGSPRCSLWDIHPHSHEVEGSLVLWARSSHGKVKWGCGHLLVLLPQDHTFQRQACANPSDGGAHRALGESGSLWWSKTSLSQQRYFAHFKSQFCFGTRKVFTVGVVPRKSSSWSLPSGQGWLWPDAYFTWRVFCVGQ